MEISAFDAAFVGGNWGFQYLEQRKNGVNVKIDKDYWKFLKEQGVEWVGISVSMIVDDVADSTVGALYSKDKTPDAPSQWTMTDANLKYVLKQFEKHGYNTYLTTAFESDGDSPPRWLFGKTFDADVANYYSEAEWKWDPDHPDHDGFIESFWTTYIARVEHYAKLAERAGVDMFSLGTETDSLFHTTPIRASNQDFTSYVQRMIDGARQYFNGLLTYDQHYSAVTANEYYLGQEMWNTVNLDVIGISAYFKLLESVSGVSSVDVLEEAWRRVFEDTLVPLQEKNSGKSIVFTEFGYTDSVRSPTQPNADEFQKHIFSDTNSNGLDDGQETQANIYQAFFNVNHEFDELVKGMFLWDFGATTTSDKLYDKRYGTLTTFAVRGKLAEEVVAAEYNNLGLDHIGRNDDSSDELHFRSANQLDADATLLNL